jgi:hypothetical protein
MTASAAQGRCPRCGCEHGRLGPGKGPHIASWRCASCGRWLAWVSKFVFEDMTQGELADALNAAVAREPR